MKFVVEVEDFYLDGEEGLNKSLKEFVIREVVTSIWKRIEKNVQDEIVKDVKATIDGELKERINLKISQLVNFDKLPHPDTYQHKNEQITISELIKYLFLKASGWANPNETIHKIAKEFGAELKARYDIAFANQIVIKMQEVGLLEEEKVKKLLANN